MRIKKYAGEIGLKQDAFLQCLNEEKYKSKISEDLEEGSKLGVMGTPAFFVNGRMLSGAQTFSEFERVIREELARKR